MWSRKKTKAEALWPLQSFSTQGVSLAVRRDGRASGEVTAKEFRWRFGERPVKGEVTVKEAVMAVRYGVRMGGRAIYNHCPIYL